MPDDPMIEEYQPATPSQTRDAAEMLLDQLNYWRSLAASRKLRSELLAIHLAAAENVIKATASPQPATDNDAYWDALREYRLITDPDHYADG